MQYFDVGVIYCSSESMGGNWITRIAKLHAVQEATIGESCR